MSYFLGKGNPKDSVPKTFSVHVRPQMCHLQYLQHLKVAVSFGEIALNLWMTFEQS